MRLRALIEQIRDEVEPSKGKPKGMGKGSSEKSPPDKSDLGSINLDDKIHKIADILRRRIDKVKPEKADQPFPAQPGAPPIVP